MWSHLWLQYRISTTIGILWSDFDFLMDISVSGQWSHILCKYEDLLICLAIKHALKPFCAKLHRPWQMICWLSGLTQRKGNANFLAHTHSLLKNIQSKWFHNKKLFCTLSFPFELIWQSFNKICQYLIVHILTK